MYSSRIPGGQYLSKNFFNFINCIQINYKLYTTYTRLFNAPDNLIKIHQIYSQRRYFGVSPGWYPALRIPPQKKLDQVALIDRQQLNRPEIQLTSLAIFFLQKEIALINNIIIRMAANETVIDPIFINKLFQHPTFQQNLQRTIDNNSFFIHDRANEKLTRLAEDLSSLLFEETSEVLERSCRGMKVEIQGIRQELEKVKDLHFSQITKAEQYGKEISQDINFEDEQLFDLPSIKRTIHSLQERVREISLNSSAVLDTSELLRESRAKEDVVQQRISKQIVKLQENLAHQQDHLQELVNKRIEKQQKTINNILETLNELHHPAGKADKNTSLLSASKSAVKLKTFFGFG